jgi:proteic killer suppression protein
LGILLCYGSQESFPAGDGASCILLYVERAAVYAEAMIRSFGDRDTAELAQIGANRRWRSIESVARRKLNRIEAATRLEDLREPPGNMLEPLAGRRKGQFSIRINHQFRVCFTWKEDGAYGVEIVDYHNERR